MKLSKYLSAILAASLFLAACGDEGGESEPAEEEGASEETDEATKDGGSAELETNIVTIATGGSSGPYNIIDTTLADGYSNEFGVNSRTETTGASAENLNLMNQENVEMAFVMSEDRKSTRLNSSHVSTSYA